MSNIRSGEQAGDEAQVAQNIYNKIVGAGLQFQALSASISLRRELLHLAEEAQVLAAEMSRHEEPELFSKVTDVAERFSLLCKCLPEYHEAGLEGLAVDTASQMTKTHMNISMVVVKPLKEQHERLEKEQEQAFARLKEVHAQRKANDPEWQAIARTSMTEFRSIQMSIATIEKRIYTITFFGADLLEN